MDLFLYNRDVRHEKVSAILESAILLHEFTELPRNEFIIKLISQKQRFPGIIGL